MPDPSLSNEGRPGPRKSVRKAPVMHQDIAQQESNGESSFVAPTSGQPGFAPGPNIPMNQQVPLQPYSQFPQQQIPQVFGLQNGFGGRGPSPPSVPPHQLALHFEQALIARQVQQQRQGHGQPNPFAQQAQLPQNIQIAPQLDIHLNLPTFEQPVTFQAGPSQYSIPQHAPPSFPQTPHPQQQAPLGLGAASIHPQQAAWQRQAILELKTRSEADFVNSFTGGSPLPPKATLQLFQQLAQQSFPPPKQPYLQHPIQQHPQQPPPQHPQQHLEQPAPSGPPFLYYPRPRSGSISSIHFQCGMAHRRHSSMGSMAGPSANNGSMIQSRLGGAGSQISPQSSQQSNNDKKPGAEETPRSDATISSPGGNSPTPAAQSPEKADGYTVPHENEDAGDDMAAKMPNEDQIMARISANLARQTADHARAQPLHGLYTAHHKRESVPFCKASVYLDFEAADTKASMGGDSKEPRKTLMSHANRKLTHQENWAQVQKDEEMGINRFELFPAVPHPGADKVFLMYPNHLGETGIGNMHHDKDALEKIPTPGYLWQYIPRQIDTLKWYNQITELEKNVDLWIPVPLNGMMAWFGDTPYGIAHDHPLEIQMAIRPGRECEFSYAEADMLLHITMHRFRAGLDCKPQLTWKNYQMSFHNQFKWAPTLERMRVLDLMMQIDLVYWAQTLGSPLHPWSRYVQNKMRANNKLPPFPLTGGA
ncbi:hypothetical protein N431DRAFT_559470 [Stipitochalara longipes BDJ]|nr:hypothetical protein N431DRAFT_559470 [Stipitochalara longipes BDJ]